MKTLKSRLMSLMLIAMASLAPVITFAAEESAGRKASRLAGEVSGFVVLLLTLAQAAALVLMWIGISKIRKDKEQPGQGLMGQGMTSLVIAVLLYFLPRLMGVGESTIFP